MWVATMIINGNGTTKNGKCKCFTRVFAVFALLFIIFWTVIIFYASRREKPLDIQVTEDFELPHIEEKYLKKNEVPKIFHQLWKSKTIPEKWQEAHSECLRLNPEYKLVLWTDEMIYNFIAKEYPWFYKIFLGYPYHIQRVDVARYFLLYHYGGIYLDIDAQCRTPFRDIVANLTQDQKALLPMTDIYGVTNSFMVAKPRSKFFEYVIFELPSYAHGPFTIVRHTTIIFSTGPMFMSHCVMTFSSPQDIYVMSIQDYDEKHFTHAKGGSWHGMDTEIVDAFHFHYIQLSVFAVVFILAIIILRYKKDVVCCFISKVKTYWQNGSSNLSKDYKKLSSGSV